MKKYLFILVYSIFLVGCSSSSTYENFAKTMNSWIGKSLDQYVDELGYPDGSMTAPNGNKVYYYNQRWTHYLSGMAVRSGSMLLNSPASTYVQVCDTYLEVDEHKTIIKWSSKGVCVRQDVAIAKQL